MEKINLKKKIRSLTRCKMHSSCYMYLDPSYPSPYFIQLKEKKGLRKRNLPFVKHFL